MRRIATRRWTRSAPCAPRPRRRFDVIPSVSEGPVWAGGARGVLPRAARASRSLAHARDDAHGIQARNDRPLRPLERLAVVPQIPREVRAEEERVELEGELRRIDLRIEMP